MDSKFKVKVAVQALAITTDSEARLWHLTRLLAWAFLDQPKTGGERSKNAKRVGLMMLTCQVERQWSAIQNGERSETLTTLLGRYQDFGGVKKTVTCPTPRALFLRFIQKVETRTRVVSEIVEYLCRVQQQPDMTPEKFTVNFAKEFIRRRPQNPYGKSSKISKDWERYARSAAIIYAAYRCFPKLAEFRTWRELWRELNRFASQQSEVKQLVGYAAYAAGVLSQTKVRNSFTRSFLVADAVAPVLQQFDQNELQLLAGIDLKAPIA